MVFMYLIETDSAVRHLFPLVLCKSLRGNPVIPFSSNFILFFFLLFAHRFFQTQYATKESARVEKNDS